MSDSHHDSRIIHELSAPRPHLSSRYRGSSAPSSGLSLPIVVALSSPLVGDSKLLNDSHRNAMDDSDEDSDDDVVAQSGP